MFSALLLENFSGSLFVSASVIEQDRLPLMPPNEDASSVQDSDDLSLDDHRINEQLVRCRYQD